MKIYSFILYGFDLTAVEIEISFLNGLPGIKFLGQADAAIKESEIKIKSALKHQGFDLPRGKQILINLKPAHLKKRSHGLEFAVACAILWQTGQIPLPPYQKVYVYGELGLQGEVFAPHDLEALTRGLDGPLITGKNNQLDHPTIQVSHLSDLKSLSPPQGGRSLLNIKRPKIEEISFDQTQSFALKLIALGEHNALLAGPSGSGKTTFVKSILPLLQEPSSDLLRRSKRINSLVGYDVSWRPFVDPHHTITPLAMVGGGYPIFPGEVSRAHAGILYLDELLEFNSKVKEALREPIESGCMTIRRKADHLKVPAKFLLLASSNLCPCGDLVPGKIQSCRFSLTRCRSYLEKLSGPLLDRFSILIMSDGWRKEKTISLRQTYKEICEVREFVRRVRPQVKTVNGQLDPVHIALDSFIRKNLLPELSQSLRRSKALIQVARTCADIEMSEEIKAHHIEQAARLSVYPFEAIKNIFN
ncbi:MAG: ATP-binding protein [Bdellovibrionales bacterium]|nr:ATP-binding protein [Bdellovibrionales bacterium]